MKLRMHRDERHLASYQTLDFYYRLVRMRRVSDDAAIDATAVE